MSLWFGVIASSALVLGAVIGVRFELPKRLLAMLLAFAAGSLITALAFELFEDAYERGGIIRAAIGLMLGAVVFTVLSALLDRWAQAGDAKRAKAADEFQGGVDSRSRRPGLAGCRHPRRRPGKPCPGNLPGRRNGRVGTAGRDLRLQLP